MPPTNVTNPLNTPPQQNNTENLVNPIPSVQQPAPVVNPSDPGVQTVPTTNSPAQPNSLNQVSTAQTVPPPELTEKDLSGIMHSAKINQKQLARLVYEWHASLIVKIGIIILYIFWTAVIAGMFKGVGFLAWTFLSLAIFGVYAWFKKTKSDIAWYMLQSLISILIITMFILGYNGHTIP